MTRTDKTNPLARRLAARKNQKGYSIIELSIALAIVSIILVTALTGVQRILRSNKVNEDLKGLNLAASKIGVMLSNVQTTTGITQGNLVALRVFEDFRVNTATNTVTNAFGGNITVAPNTNALGTVPAEGGLIIYSSAIPPEACSDYISGLAPISSHIYATSAAAPAVNGGVYADVVKTNLAPITIAGLATACTAAAGQTITVAALVTK